MSQEAVSLGFIVAGLAVAAGFLAKWAMEQNGPVISEITEADKPVHDDYRDTYGHTNSPDRITAVLPVKAPTPAPQGLVWESTNPVVKTKKAPKKVSKAKTKPKSKRKSQRK